MKAPDFWWKRPVTLPARLLAPVGYLYGMVAGRHMAGTGARAKVPVVCVGNFTAGGAGKTPVAIALAVALREKGFRPVFLTRGYGGSVRPDTPVIVDHNSRVAEVGDEALLLARLAPTVVAPDRVRGARLAEDRLGPDVIVMDDGLQNPALAKDVAIAVLDGMNGVGNGFCIPAGPLRAPVAIQAERVDALLAVSLGQGVADAMEIGAAAKKPVYRASFTVDEQIGEKVAGEKVLAFAGIGHPDKFFRTLGDLYAKVAVARAFPDHHCFTDSEARALVDEARTRRLRLVTTEKDAVRLKGSAALEALAAETLVVPVRIVLPKELVQLVLEKISPAR